MARAWGGAGAWAQEAELADQEAKEREAQTYRAPGTVKEEAFPSLGDSLSSKPSKKKNKGVTVSLSELMVGKYVGPGGKQRSSYTDGAKLTTEELLSLPTGPRERSDDDAPVGGLGGAFKDYGGFRGGANDRANEERRGGGFGGGYGGDREREERGFGRERSRERDDGPSRADADDKWGATKKFVPSLPSERGGGERGGSEEERGRGGRVSDRDLPSRADEVENWGSTKKFVPTAPAEGYNERRSTGRYEERRVSMGGFEDHPRGGDREVVSRADEVENWGKSKKFVPSAGPPSRGAGGGFESTYREAGADADRWARKEPVGRESEAARVTERPRLKLAPRTVPVDSPPRPASGGEVNGAKEGAGGVGEAEQQGSGSPAQAQRPRRLNPFGAARPREEILAEKGQDYRKIDAELEVPRERYGRPGSSHSNRPGSSHSTRPGSRPGTPGGASSRPGTPEVPRSRPSPFGEARPRDRSLVEARGNDSQTLNVDLERRLAEEESVKDGAVREAAASE